jgi:hypothetical protein
MRRLSLILLLLICAAYLPTSASQHNVTDIYLVIYATYKGKTGHAGIAMDKYKIVYREVRTEAGIIWKEDTVKTGELVYFDFWPSEDYFNKVRTAKDIPGTFYKLPEKIFDEITLNSLISTGIPHKEHYPCDGLLRIITTAAMDYQVLRLLDSVVAQARKFNARRFNCTDFVLLPLQLAMHQKIKAREFVPVSFSSTPNKLYRRLRNQKGVEVLKNADRRTAGSFIGERVLFTIFH